MARLPPCGPPHDTPALRERYKGLIRQLPSRSFIDRLVDIFMKEYNWQYYFVDPDIFDRQLEEWNALPFSIFSSDGPHGIPPDLRVFPAVLFQVVAAALLVVPEELAEEFAALKYAANMTYEDLACDYSESGASIVSLLGKTGLSVTTVQAEFLRASFLKFTAGVTESVRSPLHPFTGFGSPGHLSTSLTLIWQWHMVAIAIRDAQELGMHRDSLDPKPASPKVEDVLQNQWSIERRRKMYMVLALWLVSPLGLLLLNHFVCHPMACAHVCVSHSHEPKGHQYVHCAGPPGGNRLETWPPVFAHRCSGAIKPVQDASGCSRH